MHVTKNRDVHNESAHESISASSFYMDLEDVDSLTDSEVITRANLDALTEKSIIEAIYKAQVNRTVLSISHRTYTLSDSREVEIS